MNGLATKLVDSAFKEIYPACTNTIYYDEVVMKKIVELVVRECADVALREDHDPSDCILNHFGVK